MTDTSKEAVERLIDDEIAETGSISVPMESMLHALREERDAANKRDADSCRAWQNQAKTIIDLQAQLTAANEKLASAQAALSKVKAFAKEMRKSQRLVGPSEYQGRPTLMNVWTRTRYHDGKDILELIRATHPTTPASQEKKDA